MPKKTTMPNFKSEQEEAQWWDSHPDFLANQLEKAAKEGKIPRPAATSQSVTIRISTNDVSAARKLAEQKGLPYQTYIKMLLHQALEKERLAG